MEHCHACFQSIHIAENGYLMIQKESSLVPIAENLSFKELSESLYYVKYKTKLALKELLAFLQSYLDLKVYQAALMETLIKPSRHSFSSLEAIYYQAFNEETVEVILKGELISHLQPIVSLQTDELYGFESLLRTPAANIPPSSLFEVAQKTHTHSLLDKRAREQAIIAKKERIPEGKKAFINFLPSTIYNPDYCLKHTFHLVEKYGISPDDLVFEVVETEKIDDFDHLKKILDTYRRNGMKVALDDLGAGFSTPEVLSELMPDYVKIDRHYIDGCQKDIRKQTFIHKVGTLAKTLGITVLAEGIETKEEYEYLRSAGITLAQGYYIGKPAYSPSVFASV